MSILQPESPGSFNEFAQQYSEKLSNAELRDKYSEQLARYNRELKLQLGDIVEVAMLEDGIQRTEAVTANKEF